MTHGTKRRALARSSALAIALAATAPAQAINIQFDYRYDTKGFFTDQATGAPVSEHRAMLEYAGSFYKNFGDNLAPINAGADDNWSVEITHPSLDGLPITLNNFEVPEDTVTIFVGGGKSHPAVLGFAGIGRNIQASGSREFVDSALNRKQGDNDFAPWGGYIWFNSVHNWHMSKSTNGLNHSTPDFLTTAVHEIGHILGFGTAGSWRSQINDQGYFTGTKSSQIYGGPVPLDQNGSHWAEGTQGFYNGLLQETIMDPSTPFGQRQLITDLDYAGFEDMGWEVKPVPLNGSLAYLAGGLLLFRQFAKRKGKNS